MHPIQTYWPVDMHHPTWLFTLYYAVPSDYFTVNVLYRVTCTAYDNATWSQMVPGSQ